ncbi:MAG: hypothetical protein PHQ47_02645, partial [Candidatus Portnoybacteria bacterium]|nr:hypothetical protein [Candidatus Portnoybacteria bacterium]
QEPINFDWRDKAGEWLKKNQGDIALFFGFIAVAIISFGIGYFSAPEMKKLPLIIEEPEAFQASINEAIQPEPGSVQSQSQSQAQNGDEKGIIVASKNGTKYHWPWCSFAKNIKESNQVWFNSEKEAQAAGYGKCGNFDKLIPAGYQLE